MPRPRLSHSTGKKPFPYLLVILLLLNTVLLFGIYAYFVMRQGVNWLFWVYLGVLLAATLAYIIYNYAFSRASCTFYNLPSDWSDEKKNAFLAERDEHKRKSKWLLLIIFPICLSLFFDVIYLFFGDTLSSLFEKVAKGLGL